MDQVSRPMLIALAATVLFAATWMTVLRPKAAQEAAGNAPAAALSAPVDRARGAVAKANAASSRSGRAGSGARSAPQSDQRAPEPAVAAAPGAAAPRAAAAGGGRTVLLFAGAGADDAVAREVVRSVRGPGVRVIVAGLEDVGRYQRLLGDIQVAGAPTILVIGPKRTAREIEGLPDELQVRQALAAVR